MERPSYVSADAEWYEDGFTMEEQAEFKKQFENERRNNGIKLSLTENFQAESADKLISKLRQELAAANAYIEELEEENTPKYKEIKRRSVEIKEENDRLIARNKRLEEDYKKIANKYSEDMNTILSIDDRYQKQKEEIDSLTLEVEKLRSVRDQLIYQLNLYKA